jgi:hypothetical protein
MTKYLPRLKRRVYRSPNIPPRIYRSERIPSIEQQSKQVEVEQRRFNKTASFLQTLVGGAAFVLGVATGNPVMVTNASTIISIAVFNMRSWWWGNNIRATAVARNCCLRSQIFHSARY